ncbi:hypothetical protein L3Y34_000439 [Caenorhabditis briggsae]|uniref:Uncharacterized protein n=1 Tax=Caenorhabditis briggsae TaxID=6238 RepID=A0AAE9IMC0_CAEBR|nr:hypothetical protein L3Y34_000439 [Caenorhabditis briggsae]
MSTSPKSQQIIRCLALVLSDQEIEERNRSQQVQQPVQLHLVQPPIRAPVRSVSSPPVQPAVLQVVQPHVALHEDHDDDQEMESDEIADKKLPFIIFSINSSPHAVTKVSPHRALFGRELTTPEDIQLGPKPKDCIGSSYLDLEDFEECLKRHLQDLHIIIQERIKDQIGRNKERHMKTHRVKERKV